MGQYAKLETQPFWGGKMKRKRYSKEFKNKVAVAAIKAQRTVNEIASEFGIHPAQVNR